MQKLTMVAPAPVVTEPDRRLRLDTKFVDGMRLQCALWDGPVEVILRRDSGPVPFGESHDPEQLPFTIRLIDRDAPIDGTSFETGTMIFADADMTDVLHLADPAQRSADSRIVFTIEYDLRTRLQVLTLESERGWVGRMKGRVWLLWQETRRRRAMRLGDGVQANGYPADRAYRRLNNNTLLYLDGRMHRAIMATEAEQAARAAHISGGRPLRLIHSGRLEPMKGTQDLMPVARGLQRAGVAFTLDIFGTGSLAAPLAKAIRDEGLSDIVRLHAPVPYERELVPFSRQKADMFLSCHRQSDPSCTYLEAMGCGLPIIGYDNRMWARMAQDSGGGWAVPLGKPDAIVAQLVRLSQTRDEIVSASAAALNFARDHGFHREFERRMDHLAQTAQRA